MNQKTIFDNTRNILDKIKKTISDLNELKSSKKSLNSNLELDISIKILSKVHHIVANFNTDYQLLEVAIGTRFVFEALINVKLLNFEQKHIYRLYNALLNQNIIKNKKYETQIKNDLELINQKIIEESNGLNYDKNEIESSAKINENKKIQLLNALNEYEKNILKHEDNKKQFQVSCIKNKKFKQAVGKESIQENEIDSLLTEPEGGWEGKSILLGLESEYRLMYDFSSSMIHATSYSLLTNVDITSDELGFYLNSLNNYLTQINDNIIHFCNLNIIQTPNLKHVHLKYEEKNIIKEEGVNFYKSNGFCPECFLTKEKTKQIMYINRNDYFECSKCKLQIVKKSSQIAYILPLSNRGNGDFDKSLSCEIELKNVYFSKPSIDSLRQKNNDQLFTYHELKSFFNSKGTE